MTYSDHLPEVTGKAVTEERVQRVLGSLGDFALRPLGWRMLVMPLEPERTTESGIELVESTHQAQQMLQTVGRIIAMGDACWKAVTRSGIDLSALYHPQVGDHVIYGRWAGQEICLRAEKERVILRILADTDVIAVVDGDPSRVVSYV